MYRGSVSSLSIAYSSIYDRFSSATGSSRPFMNGPSSLSSIFELEN